MARSMASSIASHSEPLLFLHFFLAHALLLLGIIQLLHCSLGAAAAQSHRSNLPPCEPEQAAALLLLKASFPVTNHSTSPACALASWPAGTADCCRWAGVRCGYVVPRYITGGQVVFLDLSNCACGPGKKKVPLDAVALFYLPSLRHVDRACDDDDGFINGSSSSKLKLPPQVSEVSFIPLKPRNDLNDPGYPADAAPEEKLNTMAWAAGMI